MNLDYSQWVARRMNMDVPDHMRLHKFATEGVRPGYPKIVHYEDWMLPLIKQYKILDLGTRYGARFSMTADDLAVAYRAGLQGDWDTYNNYVGLIELARKEPGDTYESLRAQMERITGPLNIHKVK